MTLPDRICHLDEYAILRAPDPNSFGPKENGSVKTMLEGPYDEEFQSKMVACISVFLVGKLDDHAC